MSLLGSEDAETRVAAFLVDMAQRLAARGSSPQVFDLPMSRQQIASYLGLTIETVSRTLTQFARSGLIELLPASLSIGLCNKLALRGLNA